MNRPRDPITLSAHTGFILDADARRAILQMVTDLYELAARRFGCTGELPRIRFDLRGRAAGQWRLQQGRESLRFNERLFAAAPEEHMPDTVAHEVAHSVVWRCHGRGPRPHGPEWRRVMEALGCAPRVTHFTSAEVLARVLENHLYRCACRSHALGPRQHRHARRGERHYRCRACGERLVWTG
jgi:SprT protein